MNVSDNAPIFMTGIGNPNTTADSLDVHVANKILASRYIVNPADNLLQKKLRTVSVMTTGVMGPAEISTPEIIKCISHGIKSAFVILI